MNDQKSQAQLVISDEFGERLRHVRKQLGLIQKDFGEKLGVSLATITRLERGQFKPQADFLIKLVTTYGCDIRWLLTGQEQGTEGGGNKQVTRHPRIYNMIKAQRDEWIEIVNAAMQPVEGGEEKERALAEESIKSYRKGIDYLDELLKVGMDQD